MSSPYEKATQLCPVVLWSGHFLHLQLSSMPWKGCTTSSVATECGMRGSVLAGEESPGAQGAAWLPRGGSKGYHPCKGTSCSHLCCPPLACPKTSVKPGLKLFTSACAFPEKHSNIESHPLFPSPPAGQVYPMGAAVKNAHSHPKSQISAPVS